MTEHGGYLDLGQFSSPPGGIATTPPTVPASVLREHLLPAHLLVAVLQHPPYQALLLQPLLLVGCRIFHPGLLETFLILLAQSQIKPIQFQFHLENPTGEPEVVVVVVPAPVPVPALVVPVPVLVVVAKFTLLEARIKLFNGYLFFSLPKKFQVEHS